LLIDGQPLRKYRERIQSLLGLVGLEDRAEHRPEQLSGGQQQRVAIARALANQPEIILADEPTGNLDSRAGASILDLLRRSCSEMGATIVMVTHDARAASYASRVVFLKDGQIVRMLGDGGRDPTAQHAGIPMQEIMDEISRLEEESPAEAELAGFDAPGKGQTS
jgi:ABC-type lipoprotein export system ATPase subunit